MLPVDASIDGPVRELVEQPCWKRSRSVLNTDREAMKGGDGGAGASVDGKSSGGSIAADAELAAVQETPEAGAHAPVGPQRSTYGRLGDGMGDEKS